MPQRFDIAVIGAGMAGASLTAALAPRARVVMIEAEAQPGYHATGRSAAFWTESYGGPGVVPLTLASGPFLREGSFLAPRGALTLARAGQEGEAVSFAARYGALGVNAQLVEGAALAAMVPGLRPGWTMGVSEPDCCDIDVAALHQHYLAQARRAGADLRGGARLLRAERGAAGWRLDTGTGEPLEAALLVNAAGAWADDVARAAGVRPLGIQPYRRTVAQLRTVPVAPQSLPLVLDLGESFYFKPESGRLWLSPHDETASPPCDAAADELDVALAIARFEGVVDWQVAAVERRWAGLRSFAPDRLPVYGPDPRDASFFWFAGQGGFGIQTAPAAAQLAAALVLGETGGALDPAPYAPARFG